LGGERTRDARGRLAPERAADELAGAKELLQVDAGLYPQAVEHVDHVLGGDVAGRALGVGAAAQARDRAVEGLHAQLERGVDVGERLAIGVVVVPAYPGDRDLSRDRLDHRADLLRGAHANGVAERHLVAPHAIELAREIGDRARADLALVRTPRDAGNVAAH